MSYKARKSTGCEYIFEGACISRVQKLKEKKIEL